MNQEIEKKYLLASLPAELAKGKEIRQGYLSVGDPEVRVRAKGEKYFTTCKGGEGFVRTEEEEEISKEVFDILWPATTAARVEKTRYEIVGTDGFVWEIDQYHGHLQGLFTAEVELPSSETEAVMPKVLKTVLIADVTEDKCYKNKILATKGLPV